MTLRDKKIGLGITGSFCNFSKVPLIIEMLLKEGAEVLPVFSDNAKTFDTRFNNAKEFREEVELLSGNKGIYTIVDAEPIGPKNMIDIFLIAPCTGNTLSKLYYAITDTPILMAAKSHLRNNKPIVLGISTNDALSMNAKNIGALINTKNIFFIPFKQDAPDTKPNSLAFNPNLTAKTIEEALDNKQLQPILDK